MISEFYKNIIPQPEKDCQLPPEVPLKFTWLVDCPLYLYSLALYSLITLFTNISVFPTIQQSKYSDIHYIAISLLPQHLKYIDNISALLPWGISLSSLLNILFCFRRQQNIMMKSVVSEIGLDSTPNHPNVGHGT